MELSEYKAGVLDFYFTPSTVQERFNSPHNVANYPTTPLLKIGVLFTILLAGYEHSPFATPTIAGESPAMICFLITVVIIGTLSIVHMILSFAGWVYSFVWWAKQSRE